MSENHCVGSAFLRCKKCVCCVCCNRVWECGCATLHTVPRVQLTSIRRANALGHHLMATNQRALFCMCYNLVCLREEEEARRSSRYRERIGHRQCFSFSSHSRVEFCLSLTVRGVFFKRIAFFRQIMYILLGIIIHVVGSIVHSSIQKRNLVQSEKFLLLTYLQSIQTIIYVLCSAVLRPSALLLKEVHSSIRLDEDEI